jgi:hypothetical protein
VDTGMPINFQPVSRSWISAGGRRANLDIRGARRTHR